MAITTPETRLLSRETFGAAQRRALPQAAVIGTTALAALVACMFVLAAATASRPSSYVPRSKAHFPEWIAGPLHGIGLATSGGVLEALVVALCVCYVVVLACARAIRSRRLWSGIVLAHVGALLAPPLLSGDVFGYLGFARLGALHGLNPYTFAADAARHDAIFPYLGWHTVTTPYGPLFTLLSYALVPLGIAAGLWTLKALAVLTSLATVAVIWRTATRLGTPAHRAVALYALNPLVLVFAVAGAHNDTLFGLLIAAGALWVVGAHERPAGVSLVLAAALKASAGLVLPFALIGAARRPRRAGALLVTVALVALVSVAVFGGHVLDIASALRTQQRQVAVHSVPSELSRLLGFGRLSEGVRLTFLGLFAAALAGALIRAWRGGSWIDCYAWATLALLACSGWLLPWYGLWALLPVSLSDNRRLRVAMLLASAYLVAIKVV